MQYSLRNLATVLHKVPLKTNRAILGFLNVRQYATHDADLVVIGSGPGGYVASIKAAQLGLKTVNVEKDPTLGGTCLNVGCIPSKSLLNNSYLYELAKHGGLAQRGINVNSVSLDLEKLMGQKSGVVKSLTGGIAQLFKKNKVTQLTGVGTIKSPNVVEVTKADGSKDTVNTKNILIATGSVVTPFPGIEVDGNVVIDSDALLSLKRVPENMILVGCGLIGIELATIWARLGSKVIGLEMGNIIGGYYIDKDILNEIAKTAKNVGIEVKFNTKVVKAEKSGDEMNVLVENTKTQKQEELKADCLFLAIGRRPYTKDLGLKNVNIEVGANGLIPVNDKMQTPVANIYAIGDCVRGPQLASKAEVEGELVVEGLVGHQTTINYDIIPSVFYSHPECAWIGPAEHMLQKKEVKYKIGKFPFLANSRAKANGDSRGFVKIISDADSGKILAVHIAGTGSGEIINECCLLMHHGGTCEDIARSCHAHPTLSEAVKEACMAVAFGKPINM